MNLISQYAWIIHFNHKIFRRKFKLTHECVCGGNYTYQHVSRTIHTPYESFDDNDVYRLVDGNVKIGILKLKWARNSRIKPSNTIGVPSIEHINSPVTFGDHKIVAAKEQRTEKLLQTLCTMPKRLKKKIFYLSDMVVTSTKGWEIKRKRQVLVCIYFWSGNYFIKFILCCSLLHYSWHGTKQPCFY